MIFSTQCIQPPVSVPGKIKWTSLFDPLVYDVPIPLPTTPCVCPRDYQMDIFIWSVGVWRPHSSAYNILCLSRGISNGHLYLICWCMMLSFLCLQHPVSVRGNIKWTSLFLFIIPLVLDALIRIITTFKGTLEQVGQNKGLHWTFLEDCRMIDNWGMWKSTIIKYWVIK